MRILPSPGPLLWVQEFYLAELTVSKNPAKNLPANARDAGSIPGLGRSLGGGNGNPLQCSCLENLMDRGTRWVTAHPWGHKRVGHDLATKQ